VPEEPSPSAYRFRVAVEPRKETTLTIREVRAGETRISAGDADAEFIAKVVASGFAAGEIEQAMRPVLERRAAVASIDRQVQELRSRQEEISNDQGRLRENMKALRGSSEERQLLQRYTRELDEQENQLEAIRKQLSTLSEQRARAGDELRKAIEALSFEMTPAR
jgi:predicted  nucleic acid-binding Zn-ribbon protein